MIFIPRSKITVDCFTYNQNAYELFRIDHAINFFPDWWKTMPNESEKHGLIPVSTLKRCNGIQDTYKSGIILPMWSDLAIRFEEGKWDFQFADSQSIITPHSPEQWKYYADPNKFTHIKIESPWSLQCKKDINWTYIRPSWNFAPDSPLNILTGTLNFKYQHGTHINVLLKVQTLKQIVLAGQPMAHIIPHTEKQIVLKHHHVSVDEYHSKIARRLTHSFVKGYRKSMNIRKGSKCPFHF